MRERIAEIAARGAELAEIHDAWVLSRIKQLADCSIANFLLFYADGMKESDIMSVLTGEESKKKPPELRLPLTGTPGPIHGTLFIDSCVRGRFARSK